MEDSPSHNHHYQAQAPTRTELWAYERRGSGARVALTVEVLEDPYGRKIARAEISVTVRGRDRAPFRLFLLPTEIQMIADALEKAHVFIERALSEHGSSDR